MTTRSTTSGRRSPTTSSTCGAKGWWRISAFSRARSPWSSSSAERGNLTTVSVARGRPIAAPDWKNLAPWLAAGPAFLALFWEPATTLARDWWTDPDASHGLLLAPTAVYLAWRRGLASPTPQPRLGLALLAGAVVLRYLAGLAAELFTMRLSMLI